MRTVIAPRHAATAAGKVAGEVVRSCVHCGMCNATCPTFQLTGDELDGPRGRIYLMKQALEGEPVTRLTQDRLDGCLSCRACETTCPSGVQYHRLLDVGREIVAREAPRPWPQRLVRLALRRLVTTPWLIGAAIGLGRILGPVLPEELRRKVPPGVEVTPFRVAAHSRRMLMLGGCVQAAAAAHFNTLTIRVFDRIGINLTESRRAGCCGAVSAHLDDPEGARAMARRNIDAWWAEMVGGAEALVVNSSGCAAFIADYPDLLRDDPEYLDKARRVAALVRDPIQVLENAELTPRRPPAEPVIAVHEPCTLQHGLKLTGRIGRLMRGLGFETQPVVDSHLCCGSAGAYSILRPETAGKLRSAKLAALSAGAPAAIYSANIGCWMHMAETSPVPVRHWIEAVDEVLRP